MSMSTWLPLATASASAVLSTILGRIWGRRSALKQAKQERVPDGPLRDLLMEPLHRAHARWVAPRRIREDRAQRLDLAHRNAVRAVAEARRAWEEYAPGFRKLTEVAPVRQRWTLLMKALPDTAENAELRELAATLGREIDAEAQRTHCGCAFDAHDSYTDGLVRDGREWEESVWALSQALARLSAEDGRDWKFSVHQLPLGQEENPLNPLWERINQGPRP
ncbi:hypothetical protein [Streptomyces xiamenensis]|uniref:hypothetical protein n=1 Tax=Streptomyces xiamenensis TaxID=408015 RepID=UPI0037D86871